MNENNATDLRMTTEVWNALVDMMNVDQLNNFIENLNYIQDKLVSDEVVTNSVDDFGGPGKVLLMLNAFKRMSDLFQTINVALEAKGGKV
ncbi:hypothetical protein DW917_15900 [Prevotella sp. AM42-24]|jgi:hypothetical protein|uniref:hypothetical protein n=1 Tax=Prevotella sp. AM42-24 TaxID=2293125 RepID=UPI000E54AAA2|nr:hypothetical protein [Prevotella sp. AM42-24]RGH34901.1 hypothetical protein DW917_15900 [Prevotella sp. AM42-24]DAG17829.1 MAG TPA: hypothetical protein [Caudoviricetes sp.]DAM70217.1 MAG TPA: hypothetical protein [Caudoviricetes sp.]